MTAVEAKCNLTLARRILDDSKFSNGAPALRSRWNISTKREAKLWLERSNNALAFMSGRLGKWLTPSFVIVAVGRDGQNLPV